MTDQEKLLCALLSEDADHGVVDRKTQSLTTMQIAAVLHDLRIPPHQADARAVRAPRVGAV